MQCYACHQPLPTDARRCPNCGEEVYSVYTGKPANGRRIDGCLFGSVSSKDYRATMKAMALPNQVDLRPWCSPIEDQGALGSCTANATAGALEYHMIKSGKPVLRMSRLFIYYNSRRLGGHVLEDSGALISEAMAAALAYGAPNESEWPYNPMAFAFEPPPNVYADAMKYQVAQYARVDASGDGICGALANGYPLVFGVRLPMECFRAAQGSGDIPVPTTPDPSGDAGHAMLIVGYDLGKKTYLVRNSWGEGWGDHGYCRFPFEILQQRARFDEFWIFGNLAQDNAVQVVRPAAESEPLQGAVSGLAAKLRDQIRADLDKDLAQRAQDIRDRFRKQ